MSKNKELADYIMDQLSDLGNVRNIPMMGGYIFYYKERIFGGIYGNGFLVKITEVSKKFMPDSEPEPPYEGAKPMLPVTILDDRTALQNMVEEMYPELPERKPKKKKVISTKHKIEFVTRDKFILVGDLYVANPATDKPLVICLHSYSMNANVYSKLAEDLRLRGYNVLAMDLRGHGRSVYNENLKLKSRYYYKNDTWQKLPKDVIDSIKFVKANYPKVNCNDIILIGADIGANTAAVASLSLNPAPEKIVLISPMIEFKGIRMPIRTSKFNNSKIFMILAKTDRILINFQTKYPVKVKNYPLGGPGVRLIQINKDAYEDVLNFIEQ